MNHSTYMQHVLRLAETGWPLVAPNPMVGCVIVKDNKVIAEGYHQKFGEAHAEVNAINSLGPGFDFSNCTLYVNLEPCSHQGKTPPCSDLIISKKFKKVVICNVDTNPLVGGKGIEKLKKAGIEVETGILEKEGRELNKRFFTFHEKKRPYIILKWAQTNDGFISQQPVPENKSENWITGDDNRKLVHEWRAQEQAIMVGTNTVICDDPELTVRMAEGKNPVRVTIDKDLKLKPDSKIFNDASETLVFTRLDKASFGNTYFIKIDFSKTILPQILTKLFDSTISSLIVEGGATLLQSFINENLWDEARVFKNPHKNFGSGVKAPQLDMSNAIQVKSGMDHLLTIKNPYY
jgi:diaminohydroxyphosphoribosylaminopyrimidine deaminase/5-amino-6-(5-phosphoribosylamino)uracil reductase